MTNQGTIKSTPAEVIENKSFTIKKDFNVGNVNFTIESVDLHRLKDMYYIVTTVSFKNISNKYLADFNIVKNSHSLNNKELDVNYNWGQWKFIKDQWIGTFDIHLNDSFKIQMEYQLEKTELFDNEDLSVQ